MNQLFSSFVIWWTRTNRSDGLWFQPTAIICGQGAGKHGERRISMACRGHICIGEQVLKLNIPSVLKFCSIEDANELKRWITVSASKTRLWTRHEQTWWKKYFYSMPGTCLRWKTSLEVKWAIDSLVSLYREGGWTEATNADNYLYFNIYVFNPLTFFWIEAFLHFH